MQGTSGNHFAGEAEPRISQIPWNPQWHAYPPLTTASWPAVCLQRAFWRGMWAPFMLSMWLLLCHVGSTSDRTGSTESFARVRNMHLLYLFRKRDLCVLRDQTDGDLPVLRRCLGLFAGGWVGLLPNPHSAKMVLSGARLLARFPLSSSLLGSPTCQSYRKIIEIILLLVLSECFIQELWYYLHLNP